MTENSIARVSGIMAVYNGAAYLREAIDSMLRQSFPLAEIIVVDDGSTDETATILASYGDAIQAISQNNSGQCAALATGHHASTGDFLTFLDADDIWEADKTEAQMNALAADNDLDAVFGVSEQFVSPELDAPLQQSLRPKDRYLNGEIAAGMMVRRAQFERFGGFDPASESSYFFDWLAKAKRGNLRAKMLDQVVFRRRLHPNNFGRTSKADRDRALLSSLRRNILAGRRSSNEK